MALPATKLPLAGSERPRPDDHALVGAAHAEGIIGATALLRAKPGSNPLISLEAWQAKSPAEHRFLTPSEFAEIHGAADSDLAAVTAWLTSQGLTVLDQHAGRRSITFQGSVAQLETAFAITLNAYEAARPLSRPQTRHSGPSAESASTYFYHSYDGPINLPASLAGIVVAVVGLDNRSLGGPGGSSGDPPSSKQLAVPTIAQYYNFPNSGASDQTIAVLAPSDPPGPGQRVCGYLSNDIVNLYIPNLTNAAYHTPPVLNDVSLTVGTNTYNNATAQVSISNNFALEITQDISTSATIAQGATINVYFTEITEQGLIVCLNRILQPEGEKQPTVVTCSFNFWGGDESIGSPSSSGSAAGIISPLFQSLAMLGINVLIISQDRGSNDGISDGSTHVNYPGSDPWVTSVGGTVVGDVQTGPPLTFKEWVWSNVTSSSPVGGFAGASGGGSSRVFPLPAYQSAVGITQITDSKGNTSTNRILPDIAGMVAYGGVVGSPNDWFYIAGSQFNFIGTSCACPLFAGLIAVLRSALGRPFGFLNPLLNQIGPTACNDVTLGNNDPADGSNAPYYTASKGFNACTGWGSIDGTKLLNGLASTLYNPSFYFQVNKGSFGLDEVAINADFSTPTPFWLVLEGFTPNAVASAKIAPKIQVTVEGMNVAVGASRAELASAPDTPQRIYFACTLSFAPSAVATTQNGGIFPPAGNTPTPTQVALIASSVTVAGRLLPPALTVLQLEPGADPYFANFATNGEFWLSQDLRVFTVTPGIPALKTPISDIPLNASNNTKFDTAAGYAYIQKVLANLNQNYSSPTGTDPFTLFPDQTRAFNGDSSVTPTQVDPAHPTGTPFTNYNFAVARVRINGKPNTVTSSNVRVLFRLFAAQTSDTDYQALTYPSTLDSEGQPLAPLVGVGDVTIPFFATGNYEKNADGPVNTDYAGNSINNQPVRIGASGQTWAYYGCYLNIYPTANTIGGRAVQTLLPSTHSCLVAQLVYDDAPLATGPGVVQGPEYSDNFAQRNLQITYSDNPGPAETHIAPQTFDTRPGPAPVSGKLGDYPDEFMIDWGNTPVGSIASVYWPAVEATDVLALAGARYSTHQLSAADAHTISCKVPAGITCIPIPAGTGPNFAGLFTVSLPVGIKAGKKFVITVRRISTHPQLDARPTSSVPRVRSEVSIHPSATSSRLTRVWRYVVGTFAVQIPVTTANVMLPPEENTLSILRWRRSQMAPGNRWAAVLDRYLQIIEGRVQGLGGHPGCIQPSPWGSYGPPDADNGHGGPTNGHGGPSQGHNSHGCAVGKIVGLCYDRFGDFDGFDLRAENGHMHRYRACESALERLARTAWHERILLRVVSDQHRAHVPAEIMLLRA